MRDFSDDLKVVRERVSAARAYLRVDLSRDRLAELEAEVARPDLWDDQEAARAVNQELSYVRDDVDRYDDLVQRLSDAETLDEMAREEGDETLEGEIAAAIHALGAALDALELRAQFSGEYDDGDAICDLHAGEGGTDAQDWTEMLLRMYLRWAERHGFSAELDDVSAGKEAGLLSATFIVKGRYAYGMLRAEQGVHRLVRLSPFDAAHRRQTSFASLEVIPFVEDASAELEIDEKDLRVDTYRSSGAGGQHVNVTDSAVRITHLPTGIVVSCQNERSQHQNKARAMQILGAKLVERAREERQAELEAISGPTASAAMGNQIRSYVLHPYQLVKDLRTNVETGAVDNVLDGDIDQFIEAYLRGEAAG